MLTTEDVKNLKDFLNEPYIEQYINLYGDILERLIRIDNSLFILDQIESVPIELFVDPTRNVFWPFVRWNFKDMLIVTMHGLVYDQEKNAHTLPKFKNLLLKEWLLESKRPCFQNIFRGADFNKHVKLLNKRLPDLRHKFLAHRLLDPATGNLTESDGGISNSELRNIFKACTGLFDICSFGVKNETRLIPYLVASIDPRNNILDIQNILNFIARESAFVNMPEVYGSIVWPLIRDTKSKEEIEELNRWRRKFGKSEV